MFVIKNTKTAYDSYLTPDNKWAGLLQAKHFNTQEEATKELPQNGEVRDYEKLIGLKK